MKRFLLMMSLIPCLVIAQKMPERSKLMNWKFMQIQQSALRSDELVVLDSMYNYQGKPGVLSQLSRFTNDEMGRPISRMIEYYSWTGEPGASFWKREYEYEKNLREPSVETYYRLEEDTWIITSKDETDFNEFGVLAETRHYNYEEEEWVLSEKTTVTNFDENGHYVTFIDSIFEGKELQIMKGEVTYSEGYKSGIANLYWWNDEIQKWQHLQINNLTMDDNMNIIHDEAFEKYEKDEWSPYYDIFYMYDERNNLIEENEISHDGSGDSFFYNRYQHFYSDNLITANQTLTNQHIKIRLENKTQSLTIDLGDATTGVLSVVNLSGKTILQNTLKGQISTTSLQSIPNGIYIIRVYTPQGSKIEKILLQ